MVATQMTMRKAILWIMEHGNEYAKAYADKLLIAIREYGREGLESQVPYILSNLRGAGCREVREYFRTLQLEPIGPADGKRRGELIDGQLIVDHDALGWAIGVQWNS